MDSVNASTRLSVSPVNLPPQVLSLMRLSSDPLESQFLQLLPIHCRRRTSHQIAGLLVFRKRDHVADIGGAGQHHGPAIDAESNAAVRRRPVAQRIEQESKPLSCLFPGHS